MTISLAAMMKGAEAKPAEAAPRFVRITKTAVAEQVVYGVVYAPNQIDTWGEYMTAQDVREIAHRYMVLKLNETIDTSHDNVNTGCQPIESFIARAGDPDYPEGAWIMGVKIHDGAIWDRVMRGELNGFSYEAMVRKVPMLVEIEIEQEQIGTTEEVEGHSHYFFVEIDDNGVVRGGRTSTTNGHSHEIRMATATEPGGADGHSHRYFI